mmetsp:Transcript_35404/g.49141  ORF Transcript_35404/g.49141 Transcript_35404/m.49141 type:complete len:248 (+) Transcript_35404:516-1259(+)
MIEATSSSGSFAEVRWERLRIGPVSARTSSDFVFLCWDPANSCFRCAAHEDASSSSSFKFSSSDSSNSALTAHEASSSSSSSSSTSIPINSATATISACNAESSFNLAGDVSTTTPSSLSLPVPFSMTTAGQVKTSQNCRKMLKAGLLFPSRLFLRVPVPFVIKKRLFLASLKACISSWLSLCGTPLLPVPRRLAASPRLRRSTSSKVGRPVAFSTTGEEARDQTTPFLDTGLILKAGAMVKPLVRV